MTKTGHLVVSNREERTIRIIIVKFLLRPPLVDSGISFSLCGGCVEAGNFLLVFNVKARE